MRITTIGFTQRVNLGNYEHVEFSVEAIIDESEKAAETVDKLQKFADWSVQKKVRDEKAKKFEAEMKSGKLSMEENEKRAKWLEQYKELNDLAFTI